MARKPRLLALVSIDTMARLLFLLLLASLFVLGDGYVLVIASRRVGIYLLLAVEAVTGIVAVVSILNAYRHAVAAARDHVEHDHYPVTEFRTLGCFWVAAVLLVLPGFLTDALGLAVLLPPLRWVVGTWIEKMNRGAFEELYEYLKMED